MSPASKRMTIDDPLVTCKRLEDSRVNPDMLTLGRRDYWHISQTTIFLRLHFHFLQSLTGTPSPGPDPGPGRYLE